MARAGTTRRTVHSFLGKPVGRHATKNPPIRPLLVIRAVRASRDRRPRTKTHIIFTHVFGYTTARPPVRRPIVLLQGDQLLQRRLPRARTHVLLARPVGRHATVAPPVRRLLVVLQTRRVKRPLPHTQILLGKPVGRHATVKPPVRRLQVLLARVRQRRPTLAKFLRLVVHPVVVLTAHVRKLQVLLVRRRAQPRIHSKFTSVFGSTTAKPPVRAIRVRLARIKRPVLLSTRFTKVVRTFGALAAAVFPKRLQVIRARRRPARFIASRLRPPTPSLFVVFPQGLSIFLVPGRKPTRGTVRLGRPVARHATTNPPIRPLRTLGFAARDRSKRRFVQGHATRIAPILFHAAAVPPPTIFYQGDGYKRRKKRKRLEQERLFAAIERTIQELVYGPETTHARTAHQKAIPAPALDLSRGLDAALDQLLAVAHERRDLSARVTALRQSIGAYEEAKRRQAEEDDDEVMLGF